MPKPINMAPKILGQNLRIIESAMVLRLVKYCDYLVSETSLVSIQTVVSLTSLRS